MHGLSETEIIIWIIGYVVIMIVFFFSSSHNDEFGSISLGAACWPIILATIVVFSIFILPGLLLEWIGKKIAELR